MVMAISCDKPLSPTLADSLEMVKAAEAKGVNTQVGFNYIKNPPLKLARQMVESGELGELTGFHGIHAEDYMHDPQSPWTWRIDPSGGPGVIADLGSHIIGMARFLLGDIMKALDVGAYGIICPMIKQPRGSGTLRLLHALSAARRAQLRPHPRALCGRR
jgi:predicted dehydrogenase